MKKTDFEYYDAILEYLLKKKNENVTFKELTKNVLPVLPYVINESITHEDNTEGYIANIFETHNSPEGLRSALDYLRKKDLVSFNYIKPIDDTNVTITEDGKIKITTNGFDKEHKTSVSDRKFDKREKIATLIIAILALLLSIFNTYQASK